MANSKSFLSSSLGFSLVTTLYSSTPKSLSWIKTFPFKYLMSSFTESLSNFILTSLMFFFLVKISRAFSSKSFAAIISKKMWFISSAHFSSTTPLMAMIPPKIEVESAKYALWYASETLSAMATPHGDWCFNATQEFAPNSSANSTATFKSL